MMKAKAPQPKGITGFNPGTATISLAEGGEAVGGEISDVTKARITTKATTSIETEHTHNETSP